jgi:hypothetical protein
VTTALDRFQRIAMDHAFGRISRIDIDWLINEIRQLREQNY